MCKIAQQNSKIYSLQEKSEKRDITMYSVTPHHVISLRPVKVTPSLLTEHMYTYGGFILMFGKTNTVM